MLVEDKILLTNIQRFCLHDGPGIRTTVFLKGCSLRCPWCSSPENLFPYIQPYTKDGIKGVYGKWYSPDELVKECLKDKGFFEGKTGNWNIRNAEDIEYLPGGITFSGGEALLQIKQLVPVCEELHRQDVSIAVESSLFIPTSLLSLAMEHIDFFYVDMKILDEVRCRKSEQGEIRQYLTNLEILMSSGKPVVIRVPVIGGYTDNTENRIAVKELIAKYRASTLKIELIKEHDLGADKYRSLNMECSYRGISDELMENYKRELSDLEIPVELCEI